jgi:para-aminobenzoate synthetase component 1
MLVLERGFYKNRRTFWSIQKIFYPQSWEDFFQNVETFKGKFLFFFISFERGYDLLKLKTEKQNIFPSFGVAIVEPIEGISIRKKPFFVKFIKSSLSKEEYLKRFQKIKHYIERGDIYQVNFTVRFDFSFEGEPYSLYRRFIEYQPVPYGVFFQTEDFFLIGGSMELFLQKEGSRLISKPIKGTLPKSVDPSEFFKMEKELAENLMITDMVRNDLGRIAQIGTVKVSKLFGVETFKTLHQLVSTVECQTDKGFREIIEATFPPASVTGAPKRRAMEIIDELEPHPREIYCSTVGLIKPSGDFVCNVSIRTALGKNNQLYYYAGGGIVWDSQPYKEWEEINLKMEAFLRAIKT